MNSNVWDLNLSSWRLGPGQLLTSPGNIRRKVKQVSSVLVIILTLWSWNNCANLSLCLPLTPFLSLSFLSICVCPSVWLSLSLRPSPPLFPYIDCHSIQEYSFLMNPSNSTPWRLLKVFLPLDFVCCSLFSPQCLAVSPGLAASSPFFCLSLLSAGLQDHGCSIPFSWSCLYFTTRRIREIIYN